MGNGSRNSVGGGGGGGGCGGGAVMPFECEVGLGLNTHELSYPCKNMSLINNHRQGSETGSRFGGVYGNNGGQLFVNQTNSTNQFASGISFKSDGVIGASGRLIFTANQLQELERQTMIYKYIMASIPIPPQLLLPSSTQSNRTYAGMRFSNGSDPEPWRCRRTDGKKWRCAKDVAPNQKYCDRHAHKTRSRSRKPVETQPHITKHDYQPLAPTPSSTQQPRCTEWFMKNGGVIPVTQSKRDDCSLTLSMQSGGNGNGNGNGFELEDQECFQMAVRMLDGDRSQPQWLNQAATWVGSTTTTTPGGPLGEALCLGINSSTTASPHGYSNSSTTSGSGGGGGGGEGGAWFH